MAFFFPAAVIVFREIVLCDTAVNSHNGSILYF